MYMEKSEKKRSLLKMLTDVSRIHHVKIHSCHAKIMWISVEVKSGENRRTIRESCAIIGLFISNWLVIWGGVFSLTFKFFISPIWPHPSITTPTLGSWNLHNFCKHSIGQYYTIYFNCLIRILSNREFKEIKHFHHMTDAATP